MNEEKRIAFLRELRRLMFAHGVHALEVTATKSDCSGFDSYGAGLFQFTCIELGGPDSDIQEFTE